MEKRSINLGGYNTAADGLWTLTAWSFSDPAYAQNFVKVPGSSVTLDLSGALTDGEPGFDTRTLSATFESSEGTRLERKARIDEMVNRLHGRRMDIVLPDDPDRYITGRVSVQVLYNDPAHASVSIEAICDPWRYDAEETVLYLEGTDTEQTQVLTNFGRKPVIPTILVEGGDIALTFEESTITLGEGTHITPMLYLTTGEHELTYKGAGSALLTWREAVL